MTADLPPVELAVIAVWGITSDYQTSEHHHPNHVLIPLEAFERLRVADEALTAASAAMDGQALTTCEAAARYVERFAQRLGSGPAVKERLAPINSHRHSAEEVMSIVPLLNGLASGIRAGLAPEIDWPNAPLPEGEPFEISTGDPRFDPAGVVIVNGYRFVRGPEGE